ncbi:MAG: potassium-transporting ATPase subunit F [Bacteroidota bacterium]
MRRAHWRSCKRGGGGDDKPGNDNWQLLAAGLLLYLFSALIKAEDL